MHIDDPRFPPLLTGYGVKAPDRAFAAACRGAARGDYGAADVLWARDTARVEMALVLEPDVPRRVSLQMVPLFQLAVIEALGALMPPRTSVLLRWPDQLLVNAGVAGRFRSAAPACDGDAVPDWLVVGVEIQLARPEQDHEPGHARDFTSLFEEGAGERTRSDFLEVIGSYMLSWINTWQDGGLASFAESWVGRVEGHEDPARIALAVGGGEGVQGRVLGLDEDLRLLVKVGEGDVRALAVEAMVAAQTPHETARHA